ncbi:hypothetical protein D3C87_1952660 [compost metagenome]
MLIQIEGRGENYIVYLTDSLALMDGNDGYGGGPDDFFGIRTHHHLGDSVAPVCSHHHQISFYFVYGLNHYLMQQPLFDTKARFYARFQLTFYLRKMLSCLAT